MINHQTVSIYLEQSPVLKKGEETNVVVFFKTSLTEVSFFNIRCTSFTLVFRQLIVKFNLEQRENYSSFPFRSPQKKNTLGSKKRK